MQIEVLRGDITQLKVDALVNAANNELRGGGGVDGAIHRAGGPAILEECRKIGYCATGEAVRTTPGRLPVKHLIHTVGPVYEAYPDKEQAEDLLRECYHQSLTLAANLGCQSIAFPNISTGVYGFPRERAVEIVSEWVESVRHQTRIDRCVFCCFDEENYRLYQQRFKP